MIAVSSHLRLRVCLFLLIAFRLGVGVLCSQTQSPAMTALQEHISHVQEMIRRAEQKHQSQAQQGLLWAELALEYHAAAEFSNAEDAYNRALHLLKTDPSARADYATALDDLAALYLTYNRLADAESARKQALAVRRKLGNPVETAVSQIHLADIEVVHHQFKKAERTAEQGLKGMQSAPDPPHAGMLSAFLILTYAQCAQKRCVEGLKNAELAVAFANQNYEPESAALGFAQEALGFAEWKTGATQDAERVILQAIQQLRKSLAPADPRLAGALLEYRSYLLDTNRKVEAQEVHDQATRVLSQAGVSCPGCTISVNSLSNTLR
jgi:tetratricopeptide (TPR) repeat protein